MQRYNRTNFVSTSVAKQLIAAMREVLAQGHSAYLANRNGKRWMRVSVNGENFQGTFLKQHFEFYAGSGQDVGELIFQASFEWDHALQDEFFQVMGELDRLRKHLWDAVQDHKQALESLDAFEEHAKRSAELYLLKTSGATHVGSDSLGKRVYLSFRKTWFGFGKTETTVHTIETGLFGGPQVHCQRVNGEAFTIVGVL